MTEEDRLWTNMEELSLEKGDVVAVYARRDILPEEIAHLGNMLSEIGKDMGVLFFMMMEGDCIRKLPEDVMNTYGWYRK